MNYIETGIIITKTLTLVLGGIITYLAARAYGRTGSPSLRALSIGFGVITSGAVLGGIIDLLTSLSFLQGVLVQSTLTMVGFAIIMYSLYAE
ncbi:MAG: hypothetical protein ABEI52_09745 [Halobacteriaceae archaeon]